MTILNLAGRSAISQPYTGAADASSARRFVARRIGFGHPRVDDAVQLTGELIAESLRHAGTCGGRPAFTVEVTARGKGGDNVTRVSLTAETSCACWTRRVRGRGVDLVARLANRWGIRRGTDSVRVWFDLMTD